MFCLKKTLFTLVLTCALVLGIARADFTFGPATNLGDIVNSPSGDIQPGISPDGVSLYFASTRSGSSGNEDIWVTTRTRMRETMEEVWASPTNLGSSVNNQYWDRDPCVSADGLTLYFESSRPNGTTNYPHIYISTRPGTEDPWGPAQNLGQVNRECGGPCISADGLSLFMHSDRPGSIGPADLYVATRPSPSDDWGIWTATENLGEPVNSTARDFSPHISSDGRVLFFSSNRSGGIGGQDIWMTIRETEDNTWRNPVNLGPEINTVSEDAGPCISADGRTLYFHSNRPGGFGGNDLWQASIDPVVDLNRDEIVDAMDMCIMVDFWGTNEPLCDIGPMPWGDGVVDVQDLIVLAEHLFEEVDDPTLLAHWKLDEDAGNIAYDSVGTNDGTIIGSPQWRLEDGAVDGALELNGTTFIAFDPVLNPADGPFSVLIWVKGGGPGQVVASSGRTNWLMADVATGALTTELSDVGQNGDSLGPEAVITDGSWHRIAFTWDGANARLYVDTLLVAEYAQDNLVNSSARLLLGTSMNRETGTYWSGLIDDVRIYNRAVSP